MRYACVPSILLFLAILLLPACAPHQDMPSCQHLSQPYQVQYPDGDFRKSEVFACPGGDYTVTYPSDHAQDFSTKRVVTK